jgi:tetratricopeptide (TPR) repeat protein
LATIQLLRQLPPPTRDDVRIDLAEELNYLRLGQYSTARGAAVRAVEKARAGGYDFLLARALYLEAATLAPLGEGDNAIAAAEEAEKIYNTVGDQWGVSNALEYIAYVHSVRGESEAAEKLDQQALAVNRAIGNQTGAAIDLTAIAAVRETRGDVESGKKLDEEALAIYREVGDRNREAWALMGVAWAVAAEGDLAVSLRMDDQALAIFNHMADDTGAAYALNEKTSQLTMLGDLSKAKEACQLSLDLARKSGNKQSIVTSLFYLGNIAKLEGKLEEANKMFSEALSTAQLSTTPFRRRVQFNRRGRRRSRPFGEAMQRRERWLDVSTEQRPDDQITAEFCSPGSPWRRERPQTLFTDDAARALFGQARIGKGMSFLITNGRVQPQPVTRRSPGVSQDCHC